MVQERMKHIHVGHESTEETARAALTHSYHNVNTLETIVPYNAGEELMRCVSRHFLNRLEV